MRVSNPGARMVAVGSGVSCVGCVGLLIGHPTPRPAVWRRPCASTTRARSPAGAGRWPGGTSRAACPQGRRRWGCSRATPAGRSRALLPVDVVVLDEVPVAELAGQRRVLGAECVVAVEADDE